ncbi:lysophospholipid acyltransferase family protein [Pedobacter nototheniae]|uniref:lysophospholipid acyltransferase family protein n=1 Tax=Pedobacter nototheniae TaxID=2488994 RepID=UPI00103864D4|nr:lysophospholipid acyltransferase family protein [Pedobacter nototheniae]
MFLFKLVDKIGQYFAYWIIYAVLLLISLLPLNFLKYTFGKVLYKLSYSVLKYRYPVIIQNLSRCFPKKSYAAIKQTALAFYANLTNMVIETIKLLSISKKDLLKKVRIDNIELLDFYFKQERDIIVMLGHYGNWEYLNILPEIIPFQVNAVYKPLSSLVMSKLIDKLRTRFGMKMIPANQALRTLLRENNKPQMSLFLADQFPGVAVKSTFSFMNQLTTFFTGAEKLAKATNSVVLYLEIITKNNSNWALKFSLITTDPKQTEENEITQLFINKLEQSIFCDPAQWLWSHKRWK